MWKVISLLFIVLLIIESSLCGNHISRLDSIYNQYRIRLRSNFMVLDSCVEKQGVNIPAATINYTAQQIEWWDANSNMSHYLSMLATEYAILLQQNAPTLQTRTELFYAMLAFERLDLYSEAQIRSLYKYEGNDTSLVVKPGCDINGFHTRDDISPEFWISVRHRFPVDTFQSIYTNSNRQAISQDNIIHHLEGMSLASALVRTISIKDIPVKFNTPIIPNYLRRKKIWVKDSIDFHKWVADFAHRYLHLMQNRVKKRLPKPFWGVKTHWYIANPLNLQLVKEGSGIDLDLALFYQFGFVETARNLTGKDLRTYNGLSPTPGLIFKFLLRHRTINLPGSMFDIPIVFDDYKLRSLATTGNVLGNETLNWLLYHRNVSSVFKYEHFPLIWLVLHSNNAAQTLADKGLFNSEKAYYEALFADIPQNGSNSYNSANWRSVSRCVWPENLTKFYDIEKDFSGLDFMMLYNLYKLVFIQ